jgi:hypothetical protein
MLLPRGNLRQIPVGWNCSASKTRFSATLAIFQGPTLVRELHKSFNILYIYDYVTKLCRQQAEVIQKHENANVRNIGQGQAQHKEHKRIKLGGGQAYDRSSV